MAVSDEVVTSPSDDAVLQRIEDGVAWITLNRPEAGNAVTAAMRDQIVVWLENASADLAVRVVVVPRDVGEEVPGVRPLAALDLLLHEVAVWR